MILADGTQMTQHHSKTMELCGVTAKTTEEKIE